MASRSIEAFSLAIQRIYAAAEDPQLWTDALRGVEDLTGSAGATLNFVPKRPDTEGMVLSGRFPEEVCAEYARDYMAICPRTQFSILAAASGTPLSAIGYDYMFFSESEMDRDPVYDWYGKLGLRYYLGSRLPSTDRWHVNWSLQRSRRQGHVDASDIELFEQINRHVGQALKLAETIGSLRGLHSASLGLFERLPQGVILLSAQKEILFANAAADRFLVEEEALSAKNRVFGVTSRTLQSRIDKLLSAAVGLTKGEMIDPAGWLAVDRPGSSPLHLFVGPVMLDLGMTFYARPAAIVIIHDREKELCLPTPMLRELFGLTATEARLSGLLANGASLDNAAAQLGQATGTAKIHLKAIFRKVGVDRQQDLVRLLSGLTVHGMTTPFVDDPI